MPSSFFFFIWNHQENYLFFTGWVMFWNISWIYFFSFNIQNIKRNCWIIFLKRFQSYLVIKGLILIFFADLFWFFHDLMQQLLHAEKIYHPQFLDLLLLFSFLSSLENQRMVPHVENLSHDIYNTTVKLNRK